jgi:hypothetical protein
MARPDGSAGTGRQDILHRCQSDLGNTDRKVTLLPNYNAMGLTTKVRVEREK